MVKNIFVYVLAFTALFFIGFYTHNYIIESKQVSLIFSLFSVYLFHSIFSLTICVIFNFLSLKEKIYQQLGFIYLGALILKIVAFCIVFYNPVLAVENLSKTNSISLLIPIAIFLITEVYFIAKILNRK